MMMMMMMMMMTTIIIITIIIIIIIIIIITLKWGRCLGYLHQHNPRGRNIAVPAKGKNSNKRKNIIKPVKRSLKIRKRTLTQLVESGLFVVCSSKCICIVIKSDLGVVKMSILCLQKYDFGLQIMHQAFCRKRKGRPRPRRMSPIRC